MENNLILVGNESSILYYNLNSHFSTQRKILISKELIIASYENDKLKTLIQTLKTTKKESYSQVVKDAEEEGIFNAQIDENLYKEISENIPKISFNAMDVQLKDYNFMSSVSNAKFTVCLRSEAYSNHKYYIEKGAILSSIRELIKKYIKSGHNKFRPQRIENFQIEISESQDIFKKVYLKKEGDSLLLASSFGFPKNTPCDFLCGPELYFSKGEDFNFFSNTQETLMMREHSGIEEKEMKIQEKVLSNEDLIAINKATKNINDATIEIMIDKKNKIHIEHVSVLESSLQKANENGIICNLSQRNPNKISLLSFRDEIIDDYPNPKYLLLRSENEVVQLIEKLDSVEELEGIIFSYNFYSPLIDWICEQFNLDCIVYKKNGLTKSIEVKMDKENIIIGSEGVSTTNPFNQILETQNPKPQNEELLEQLKNLNINPNPTPQVKQTTQQAPPAQERDFISDMAQGLISSPQASTARKASGVNWGSAPSANSLGGGSGTKKSAISMLADAVIQNDNKPLQEEPETPQQIQSPERDFNSSELVMNGVTAQDVNPIPENLTQNQTTILTSPSILSNHYFVDSSNINEVGAGEIFFQCTSLDQIANESLNYIVPIGMHPPEQINIYALITSPSEFFNIDKNKKLQYFVNLSYVEDSMKKNFVEACSSLLDSFSVIAQKKDLSLLSAHLGKMKYLYIKDLEGIQELDLIKQQFNL